MANYTLATQRMQSGGSSGGLQNDMLQASGGAGSVRAAKIAPGAGQIQYTPTNVPKPVENMVSKGVQHFMGSAADAAFEYQQREAQFLANEATLAYQIKAREIFSGKQNEDGTYTPGLSSAKGMAAVSAYGDYTKALDDLMANTLKDMEPRVKQKALIGLQTAKNQSLSKGATHRAQQFQIAQEDQLFREKENLAIQVSVDPRGTLAKDQLGNLVRNPLTGTNVREDFIRKYPSYAKGKEAWMDLIQQATEKVYFDTVSKGGAGAQAASAFLAEYGMQELETSPRHVTALQANLRSWLHSDLSRANAAETLAIARAEADRDATWFANEAKIVARRGTPERIPLTKINEWTDKGLVDPKFTRSYQTIEYGSSLTVANDERKNSFRDSIFGAEVDDQGVVWGPHPDKPGEIVNLTNLVYTDLELSKDKNALKELSAALQKVGRTDQKVLNPIMDQIKEWEISNLPHPSLYKSVPSYKNAIDAKVYAARDRYGYMQSKGATTAELEALANAEFNKNGAALEPVDVGGFVNIKGVPSDFTQLPNFTLQVEEAHNQFKAKWGEGVYDRAYAINKKALVTYRKAFAAASEQGATDGQ